MNSFGVLANTTSESSEPIDVEFFKFTSLVPDAKVSIQTDPFTKAEYPTPVSLIACSSKYQYFVAGSITGFIYGSTKSLRTDFYNTQKAEVTTLSDKISIPLAAKVRQIKLSATETNVVLTTSDNTLLVYHVEDIKTNKEQVKPAKTINLSNATLDIKPNPEFQPNLIAILYQDNTISLLDFETGDITSTFPLNNYTALCWSRKGKQIVCGNKEGSLIAYDTNGIPKDTLEIPQELNVQEERFVKDVLWVDNNVFFAIYTSPFQSEDDDEFNAAYIIDRKINQSKQEGYMHLSEITPIFSSDGRGNRFYIELLPHLGKEVNNAIIIANAASTEISVIGENEDGEWNTWILPDNGTATLPLTDEAQDTYPLGLAIDFAADEKLDPFDASENDTPVEPFPVFYYINDEGQLGAYHCYNVEMARRGEVYTLSEPPKNTSGLATAAAPSAPSAFGSAFVKPTTTSNSSFSDLLSGKTSSTTNTAQSSFGSFGTALGGSGSFASLASAQKLPAAPSMGMGATQKPSSTPAFGSTSSVGFGTQSSFGAAAKPSTPFGGIKTETKKEDETKSAFGTSTTTPAFGSTTSFGASAATKPAFGSTTSFGASSTTTPAFGSTSFGSAATNTTKPAFGSTSFGASSTTTPAFGSTSFGGGTATKPTFGSTTAFGSPKPASTTTGSESPSSSTAPAAATTTPVATPPAPATPPSTGGFGALAKNTVPGATAPTTSPSLGGGFGALAKNTVPGAANPTSTPSFGSSSGFGALAKNTVPGAANPTSTPSFGSSSGFGALAKNTVPGAANPTSTPSFGSSSGFGTLAKNTVPGAANPTSTPSFGSSSGFGALAKNTVPGAANPTSSPSVGSSSGFGALAKNTVPGAANPTSTPSFGSSSGFGALAKNTVPGAANPTSSPSVGSSSGFGALAKNTVPGAANPTSSPSFGSSSGFGALAKNTVPGATSPSLGALGKSTVADAKSPTSLGSTSTKSDATEKSTTASSSAPVTSPVKTEQASTSPKGPVSTEKEGIAYQFESDYFSTADLLEKCESVFKRLSEQIEKTSRSLEPKTMETLKAKTEWNLNDIPALTKMLDDFTKDMSLKEPQINKIKQLIADLVENLNKLLQKRKNIEDLMDHELNNNLIDLMDARELSAETKASLNEIQGKASAALVLLEQSELKVHELRKRNKLYHPDSSNELSLYSLHRMIRDIARGLISKSNDLDKVSQALSNLSIEHAHMKAREATHGYSCDFSDSEDDDEGQVKTSSIEYTKKYIYRTQFLDGLCTNMEKKKPLQASVIR